MTALSFPSSPTVYQTYTAAGKTWYWDGTTWLYGPGPGAADANFSSVVVLLHGDEFSLDGNIKNWGSAGTVSLSNGSVLSAAVSKFGTASMYVNGTGSQLMQAVSNAAFAIGAADFTLEMWIYLVSLTANANIWDFRDSSGSNVSPLINLQSTGQLRFMQSGAAQIVSSTGVMTTGVEHHIAVSRASGVTKMFVDGVQVGSNYTDTNSYLQSGFSLGNSNIQTGIGSVPITGYMSEVRFTKGVGRYTSAFTPATLRLPNH